MKKIYYKYYAEYWVVRVFLLQLTFILLSADKKQGLAVVSGEEILSDPFAYHRDADNCASAIVGMKSAHPEIEQAELDLYNSVQLTPGVTNGNLVTIFEFPSETVATFRGACWGISSSFWTAPLATVACKIQEEQTQIVALEFRELSVCEPSNDTRVECDKLELLYTVRKSIDAMTLALGLNCEAVVIPDGLVQEQDPALQELSVESMSSRKTIRGDSVVASRAETAFSSWHKLRLFILYAGFELLWFAF